jgi:hypothetical protein
MVVWFYVVNHFRTSSSYHPIVSLISKIILVATQRWKIEGNKIKKGLGKILILKRERENSKSSCNHLIPSLSLK